MKYNLFIYIHFTIIASSLVYDPYDIALFTIIQENVLFSNSQQSMRVPKSINIFGGKLVHSHTKEIITCQSSKNISAEDKLNAISTYGNYDFNVNFYSDTFCGNRRIFNALSSAMSYQMKMRLKYVIYFSFDSLILDDMLLRFTINNNTLYCNNPNFKIDYIVDMLHIDVYNIGLSFETISRFKELKLKGGDICGMKLILFPVSVLEELNERIEEMRMLEYVFINIPTSENSSSQHELLEIFLFNLALLDMSISKIYFESNTVLDMSHEIDHFNSNDQISLSNYSVMLFSQDGHQAVDKLEFVHIESPTECRANYNYQRPVPVPVDHSSIPTTTITSYTDIIMEKLNKEKLKTVYFACQLLGDSKLSIVPSAHYLEVGGIGTFLKAKRPLSISGSSYVSPIHIQSNEYIRNLNLSLLRNRIVVENTIASDVEGHCVCASLPQSIQRFFNDSNRFSNVMYLRVHSFRIEDFCQCSSVEIFDNSIEMMLQILAQHYLSFSSVKLPCLVRFEYDNYDMLHRVESVFEKIGYIQIRENRDRTNSSLYVSPRCDIRTSKVREVVASLLQEEDVHPVLGVMDTLSHLFSVSKNIDNNTIESSVSEDLIPYHGFPQPPGLRINSLPSSPLASKDMMFTQARIAESSPISIIENVFSADILSLLQGRLFHQADIKLGANSYFVPFDDSKPRSMIEQVIKEIIAPLAVGPLVSLFDSITLLQSTRE